MAEAIKSIRRISKKLQETFKTICYYTSRHLSRTQKYKSQFIDEYKKISSKLRSDAKKNKSRDHKKHIQEKERLKKQLAELKQKKKNGDKDKDKEKEKDKDKRNYKKNDSQKSESSRQSYRQKNKNDIKNKKRNEKQQRKQKQSKQEKNQSKRKISALQKQRELDFDRDFDFKKPFYREPNNTIYEEQEDVIKIKQPKKKKQNEKGWNQKQMQTIGSTDPQKYKIMKVSQQTSDFQDQNALEKVPSIKPRQPLTPYFLFLRYNRYSIAQSYPAIERKRSFARIWKQLPQQQKQAYEQQYRRSQQVYAKKLMQFHAVNPRNILQKLKIAQQIQKKARNQKSEQKKQSKKKTRDSKNKGSQNQDDQYQPKYQKSKQKGKKSQPKKKKGQL